MTRAEQGPPTSTTQPHADDALAVDSRERAVRALLRFPPLRRLWSAQFISGIGDALAMLVLLLLAFQAARVVPGNGGEAVFGGGYQGVAFALASVFGARLLATLLFGAVLLGPLSALTAPSGPLDRRWTMFGADAFRAVALILAPLWIDWTPDNAFALVLVTAFVTSVAERFWKVSKDGAAPALLPAPPPEGAAVRPLPDHQEALRRLWLRTGFVALPLAGLALVVLTLLGRLLGTAFSWFDSHQAALPSYVAAGLFAASLSLLYFLELPSADTPRPRSPLEGLRRPKTGGDGDRGRTGAIPLLVLSGAAVGAAVAATFALALLHAVDLGRGVPVLDAKYLGRGPIYFGLIVLALTGGVAAGVRRAGGLWPTFSRRRLLAVSLASTGIALLAAGLVTDTTTALLLILLAGFSAGVAANVSHTLLDQETEAYRQARTTEHLHALVRIAVGLSVLAAPALAALIGPHRMGSGDFVFAYGGAAFTLMLVGALLLPVAALVLGRLDDRHGVPVRQDLRDALHGPPPAQAPARTGFFLAVEGGDGSGKSTQVEALAEWIRGKGHEVVVTREPGATPIGKRLRSILLDVSSGGLSSRAEALLYAADRAEHVETLVRPALERGAVVISDRYIDSSVAYQGAGRELTPTEIARISRWATEGLVPHLTVLLDVSPELARERFTEAPDRLESEPAEFHQRVRSGFLTLAAADPARYLVVDGAQEPEAVTTVVRHRLDQVLPLSEAEITAREEARRAAEEERRRRAEEEAARKAEEERKERERQEQLAKLRAEEEERKRRELEEARRLEEAKRAEEARQRAEEARRLAEEERERREAEERARREELERQRRLAEEEERLRAQAEERRLEKQRKAEEALLRAEQARLEAESAAEAAAESARPPAKDLDEDTEQNPLPTTEHPDNAATQQVPAPGRQASPSGEGPSAEDETTVMPQIQGDPDTELTTAIPRVVSSPDAEETTVMPQVPSSREERPAAEGDDRTREMPQIDPETGRPRPDWAEETPMDDLPTLADELLGSRDEDASERGEDDSGREGRRWGRR
ncbi:dTMP kinase [Streptomyces sp. NPDC005438]|uniref:dTMP kinase n=1 Tax=Streptomyces sp. NPDC005438 TaxID=3156880 RepID=UPI0033B8DCE5